VIGRRYWHWLLPIAGSWWRRLKLDEYDLVVTCSHASVNAVRVRPGAAHVSYCCTPMRYAWLWRSELGRLPAPLRIAWPLIAALLRRADRRRAANVGLFLAVSKEVAGRISRFYGRSSTVVYPPVDTSFFSPEPDTAREDFFLLAGRLVAYKHPDVAVRAANIAGARLVVAGTGRELKRLRTLAGPGVEFHEAPSNEDLRDLYRRARALVFPGVEDFGMVLVEAQACATPVIAFGSGGAREAVADGVTGMLYDDPSAEGLALAMQRFDPGAYDRGAIREHAEAFGFGAFDAAIRTAVTESVGPRNAALA
jgi:glycosyltransferase involved in cell wall biosynthesis